MGASAKGRRDADTLFAEATRLAVAGDHATALYRLRALIKISPRHWQAWQLVGNCLWATGKKEKAMQAYRYSLELHPDNPDLKVWLASPAAQ